MCIFLIRKKKAQPAQFPLVLFHLQLSDAHFGVSPPPPP